ncbi:hypothetical protein E5161_03330 [Cohnella pontilimi]|uniref:Uncharacterized protein n=1 Tax=Cohnella pontilimi TaxID=2564100 RepID=A0A4U0FHC8_9BACL|nr:hypothetical protein [Cohnella pontilimi]TJY44426.1 hypothetical protein E5161_03330 [Cohnella pontilimi]
MNHERIAELRALEADCYGVCFYMLQEEKSALQAAQAALADLYRDGEFWRLQVQERERQLFRVAVSRALKQCGQ